MAALSRSEQELALVALARRVLPGGTFGNLASDIVIAEGRAGRVWDVSGNEYVDFLLGSGPMFIGHAHPDVVAAVQAQIPLGVTFFANSEPGIRLAAAIVDAVPCAGKVRFTSSGTEADVYAMRVARAFRGRDKVLKFEGGFHGMSEYSLQSLSPKRPGNFPQATADSPGIPRSVSGDMLIAPFNNADMAAELIREHREELAAVIVEPFQRLLKPLPGFLQALRAVTEECGIPLIFDEIVTGFRFAYGGAQGRTMALFQIYARWAKSSRADFPLAAVCGRAGHHASLRSRRSGRRRTAADRHIVGQSGRLGRCRLRHVWRCCGSRGRMSAFSPPVSVTDGQADSDDPRTSWGLLGCR